MISLVIPVYNGEKTIGRCLTHVIPALGGEDEIILVNDGSQDGGEAVCRSYKEKNPAIRLITQTNQGPSGARNRGIAEARGRYICFVDGDDEVDSAAFYSFLDRVRQEDEEPDIWFNDFIMQTPDGVICRRSQSVSPTDKPQYGDEALRRYLSERGTYANVWRCLFRREFLLERRLRFEEGISCGEDLLFMTRAILTGGRFAFYHLPYYHYLVEQGESLSHNCSVRRITDFLCAFDLAYGLTGETERPVPALLRQKLLQELMLLLPHLPELSGEAFEEGKREISKRLPCLRRSPVLLHHLIYGTTRAFGVAFTTRVLYRARLWKRRKRGLPRYMGGGA